jgi:DNA-binding transcriptional MerR regulator
MDRLYTETELAEHLKVPAKTLAGWRSRGTGPPWFRAGKHVRYREPAVIQWQEAQEREAASA